MTQRGWMAAVALFGGLTLPAIGWSDVAAPEGRITVGIDDECPDPADITVDDLEYVYEGGCDELEVASLYAEDDVTDGVACRYSLDCLDEEGGCGG